MSLDCDDDDSGLVEDNGALFDDCAPCSSLPTQIVPLDCDDTMEDENDDLFNICLEEAAADDDVVVPETESMMTFAGMDIWNPVIRLMLGNEGDKIEKWIGIDGALDLDMRHECIPDSALRLLDPLNAVQLYATCLCLMTDHFGYHQVGCRTTTKRKRAATGKKRARPKANAAAVSYPNEPLLTSKNPIVWSRKRKNAGYIDAHSVAAAVACPSRTSSSSTSSQSEDNGDSLVDPNPECHFWADLPPNEMSADRESHVARNLHVDDCSCLTCHPADSSLLFDYPDAIVYDDEYDFPDLVLSGGATPAEKKLHRELQQRERELPPIFVFSDYDQVLSQQMERMDILPGRAPPILHPLRPIAFNTKGCEDISQLALPFPYLLSSKLHPSKYPESRFRTLQLIVLRHLSHASQHLVHHLRNQIPLVSFDPRLGHVSVSPSALSHLVAMILIYHIHHQMEECHDSDRNRFKITFLRYLANFSVRLAPLDWPADELCQQSLLFVLVFQMWFAHVANGRAKKKDGFDQWKAYERVYMDDKNVHVDCNPKLACLSWPLTPSDYSYSPDLLGYMTENRFKIWLLSEFLHAAARIIKFHRADLHPDLFLILSTCLRP